MVLDTRDKITLIFIFGWLYYPILLGYKIGKKIKGRYRMSGTRIAETK